MKYRLLGKSGLRVSEAALNTMTFGDEWGWGSPKTEAQKVCETHREAGGNFSDTANFNTNGTSERFMGEFIQGHRESVVLVTKYSNAAPGNDPNAAGKHRKNMMQAVEASLERLQTDYLAGDELTGNEAMAILSRVTGRPCSYYRVPLDVIRQRMGEDAVKMYEWFDRVGFTVDRAALRCEFPDIALHDFESWAKTQDWSELHA